MRDAEITSDRADELMRAFSRQPAELGVTYELVVVGGVALGVLGVVRRSTKDVDVVALIRGEDLVPSDPLPEPLVLASRRVAKDFGLPEGWLNAGPSDLARFGLPEGFRERTVTRNYRPSLTVHFAARLDQIHFKLFAMVDQGVGRHEDDLRALEPTPDELVAAARWTLTHDPSPGLRKELEAVLRYPRVQDARLD